MGLCLLLVEDQRDVARSLQRALVAQTHDVQLAASCKEALNMPGRFDCAILDIDLPDGSGIDLAPQLLASTTRNVVFFSGSGDPLLIAAAQELAPFIPKAAGVQPLLDAVLALAADEKD